MENATFAVRGGGHSPLPLWASVDEGVLISTRQIKDIQFDEGSNIIRAAMGNTWDDLYRFLEKYNRIVVGGRAPTVGLATIMGGMLCLFLKTPTLITYRRPFSPFKSLWFHF